MWRNEDQVKVGQSACDRRGHAKKDRKLGSFRYPRVVRVKDLVFGEVAAGKADEA